MANMSVDIEGSAEEVIQEIQQLGSVGQWAAVGDTDGSMETPAAGARMSEAADEAPTGEWMETLAGEFLAGLEPAARQVTGHIWQGGASGIHRSALCQRTELTPREQSLLMMRMGRALGQFQREHGVVLSRPVAANSPLRSYFVDADFAAAARSQMFDHRMAQPLADGAGRP